MKALVVLLLAGHAMLCQSGKHKFENYFSQLDSFPSFSMGE